MLAPCVAASAFPLMSGSSSRPAASADPEHCAELERRAYRSAADGPPDARAGEHSLDVIAGAWYRSGPRTSKSALRTSAPRLRRSRASRQRSVDDKRNYLMPRVVPSQIVALADRIFSQLPDVEQTPEALHHCRHRRSLRDCRVGINALSNFLNFWQSQPSASLLTRRGAIGAQSLKIVQDLLTKCPGENPSSHCRTRLHFR